MGWEGFKKFGGRVARRLPVVGEIVESVIQYAPQLEDEVTVEVVGQPGASKKQLYFLALSAAFGIVKRVDVTNAGKYLLPPPGMLMLEYDSADHWVRVTLRYKTSLLQGVAADLFTGVGAGVIDPGVNLKDLPIYSGPRCEVIGGKFEFAGELPIGAAGIPSSSEDRLAPKLPFAEKTILTPCAKVKDPNPTIPGAGGQIIDSPNPKPPGDNRSRGAVVGGGVINPGAGSVGTPGTPGDCCLNQSMLLVPLVFSALADPGSYKNMIVDPPNSGPRGS